jgi:hypothetical protein
MRIRTAGVVIAGAAAAAAIAGGVAYAANDTAQPDVPVVQPAQQEQQQPAPTKDCPLSDAPGRPSAENL